MIAPAARRNSLFFQIFENFHPAAAPRTRYDTRANEDSPHFRAAVLAETAAVPTDVRPAQLFDSRHGFAGPAATSLPLLYRLPDVVSNK
jgi:hypothetical protein